VSAARACWTAGLSERGQGLLDRGAEVLIAVAVIQRTASVGEQDPQRGEAADSDRRGGVEATGEQAQIAFHVDHLPTADRYPPAEPRRLMRLTHDSSELLAQGSAHRWLEQLLGSQLERRAELRWDAAGELAIERRRAEASPQPLASRRPGGDCRPRVSLCARAHQYYHLQRDLTGYASPVNHLNRLVGLCH
jgi:hypothetical protein